MGSKLARWWARRQWLQYLLLVVVFARAVVPTGFMPGPAGLILCPGYGPTSLQAVTHPDVDGMSGMDMPHHPGHAPDHGGLPGHEGASFCPFAAAATSMGCAGTAVVVAFVHAVAARFDLPSLPLVPRGTIVPTRLPRGPPVLLA